MFNVLEDHGHVGDWGLHAGLAATVDTLKFVAAVAADSNSNWNVLGSAQATLDMFTIAGSVEADDGDYAGAGVSLVADVADGVKLNLGGRWANYDDDQSYEIAVGGEAAVSESLALSGAVGYVSDGESDATTLAYGWAKLAWAPGGGYTASVKGTVTSGTLTTTGDEYGSGYKIETEIKKTFE